METTKKRYTYSNTYIYVGKGDKKTSFIQRKCLKCDCMKMIDERYRICSSCKVQNESCDYDEHNVLL